MRISVCSRPFRPSGPRLETGKIDEKILVHNYGHGGSGWSLSWGCAEDVAAMLGTSERKEIGVIGAGVMGLTTAHVLAERGFKVTIYTRDLPAESRSARATGVWSPSSRIALRNSVDPAFADRWESWARRSWARHQTYIGRADRPVEFVRQFDLADPDRGPRERPSRDYLHIGRRVRDIEPPWARLAADLTPFDGKTTYSGHGLVFNISSYSDILLRDFLAMGGTIVRKTFHDRDAILALPQPIIVNCTGYDSRTLWGDEGLIPVRGQIGWFIPQPEARYGVTYRNVFALSRTDGVIVQYLGPNEDWGYGDDSEIARSEETRAAAREIGSLFA